MGGRPGERSHLWVSLGVLLLGLALTAIVTSALHQREQSRVERERATDLEQTISHLSAVLERGATRIRALAAVLDVHQVSPGEFELLAARLMEGHRSTIALAAARPTDAGGQAPGEPLVVWRAMPTDGAQGPDSDVETPAVPLMMAYPPPVRDELLGMDLASGHPWAELVRRVHATGTSAAMGPVRLAWHPDAPIVLLFVASGRPSPTSSLALGLLRVDEAIAQSRAELGRHAVAVRLADESSVPDFPSAGGARARPARLDAGDEQAVVVELGGVSMSFVPVTRAPTVGLFSTPVLAVLVAGVMTSLAAGWAAGTISRARRRAALQRAELARLNESLMGSEEKYRLAMRSVAGIVYSWDAKLDRVERSEGLLAALGYEGPELTDDLQGWLALIHPDDIQEAHRRFEQAQRNADAFDVEYRVRHKDGRYVSVRDRCVILRDPDGSVRRVVGCTLSLASLRQAEEAVREANERFELFADAINDVLWTIEPSPLRVVYLSPAFERVWGIERERVYREPEAWLGAIHPDDRQRVTEASRVWSSPDAPRTRQMEYRIRRGDGSVRWVLDTAVRMDDPAGRTVRVVGVAEDITERKLAELALQEREHAYRQLFDASVTASIVFDPADCGIVQANDAAARLYGYPIERLTKMNIFDLCAGGHEELRDELAASPNPPARIESRHRLASGEIREVEVFSSAIQQRGRRLVFSLIHDITERNRVARELERSRRTLEQAQVVGRIGSWVYEPAAGGRLLWSSEVFRIFGIPPEEFDQHIGTFYRCVHPDDRAAVDAAIAAATRDHTVYRIDHRIVRPDGEVRWVLEQGEVEFADAGAPRRVVGVVQDITERREAEEALRNSQEQLRTTLDSLAEGCLVHALDGSIIMCNPAAETILGIPRDELLRRSSEDPLWPTLREDGTPIPPEEYPSNVSLRTGRAIDAMVIGIGETPERAKWLSVNSRPLRTAEGKLVGAVVSISDVTGRRAAALALEQTARRYQMLFDANPEPLWVYDSSTFRFLAVNRAAQETYGYSRDEFLSMTLFDIRPPAERARLEKHLRSASYGERARGVWVHQVRDGRPIDVEVISHPIEYEGRPARIALAKDITERMRAERAVRESEARLRDAQRIGRVGDWEYEPATGTITWSEEVYRLFRRDPSQGPPSTFEENLSLYDPPSAARLTAVVHDALEHGRESALDLRVVYPDGQTAWHRSVMQAVRDATGKVVRLRGVVQDITEQKHAEETLRATQLRLAAILEHMPDVVVYESDGSRLFPSENISSLLGYPAETFEHDRAAFLRLVHPRDRDEAARADTLLRPSSAGQPLVLQYRVRHRDGHYVWIEDRVVREHPPEGPRVILGVLIDIGERKRAEQTQRLMMAELDHRVKNNLATVMSLLDQTARTSATVLEFHQTFLGRLQALARMHKALSRTHWEGVSLRALLEQTVEPYQSAPPGRIALLGDDVTLPARSVSPIAMALHELATNAAKYGALSSPHGRVEVRWHTEPDQDAVPQLHLCWDESGGPPVIPPRSSGFGTELITGGVAYELHGEAHIEFRPGGVRCIMRIPLAHSPAPVISLPPLADTE